MSIYHHPWRRAIELEALKQCALKQCALKQGAFKHSVLLFLLATVLVSAVMVSSSVLAQEQQNTSPSSYEVESMISEAELAQTLAPIALYPDTLLTHILIASTYPIEVIQAERWLTKHSALTAKQLQKRAKGKEWDASVKALLPFPRVMSQLSEDLNWMQTLGDAFLQDEARVLASIQMLRQKAEQAGSLTSMENVQVIKEQQVIIIEPAQPEVIYVPYYDTRVVYGRWHWSHYPPVYWRHPYQYISHYGHFYWGHGVHINTHFFFSAFHWHNRHVVVSHYNRHGYHPRKKIVSSHNAKRWNHQPKHRRGVAYSSGSVKKKYYSAQPSVHNKQSIKNSRNNKKIKHSTNVRSSSAKSTSVRSKSVHNSRMKSTNARSKGQVKHHKKTAVVSHNNKVKQHRVTKVQAKPQQKNVQSKQRASQAKSVRKTVRQPNKQHKSKHH